MPDVTKPGFKNLVNDKELAALHDAVRVLPKIRNKYFSLGKEMSKLNDQILKNKFFSLGNNISDLLKSLEVFGEIPQTGPDKAKV